MSIKKDGPQTDKVEKTIRSNHDKYTMTSADNQAEMTIPMVNHVCGSALDDVLAQIERDGTSLQSVPLREIAERVYSEICSRIDELRAEIPSGNAKKALVVRELPDSIAARIVMSVRRIRMVCTKENLHRLTADGVLAEYVEDGPDRGIYRELSDGIIQTFADEIMCSASNAWKRNFKQQLHDMATQPEYRVAECSDPNLVFVQNGIFDYQTKMLMDFDPKIVSLRKHAVILPETEPAEPVHTKPDGTQITFWGWIDSLVPYDGGRDLLIKLAGAALRDRYNWRVMVTLHNKTGHNGKSTFLDCLKAMIGGSGVMTSDLQKLAGSSDGGRFGVSNIVGVSLITCEDSDSSAYIRDNSRLKSIISHDTISVERKGETMFDYTPHALIVCAANDLPKTKDKGQAWLDRNIYVPFTGEFRGKGDDKTIREMWVVSPEFCSYLAYQALVKWDAYYSLPEPNEALALKDKFVVENDPVVEFWRDVIERVPSDFLPNKWLWSHFTDWMQEARPSTKLSSRKAFMERIGEVAMDAGDWIQVMSGGKVLQMNCCKWAPKLYANDVYQGMRDRGLVRKSVYDWCNANNTTPSVLGDKYKDVRKQLGLADWSEEDEA